MGSRPLRDSCVHNLLLDVVVFGVFLFLFQEQLTGIAWHEWLGIGIGLLSIVHVVWHWAWIIAVGKRLLGRLPARERLHAVVDLVGFFAFSTAIITGLWISKSVMPMLGLEPGGSRFWRQLHHWSSDVAVLAVALHVALHWRWLVETVARLWRGRRSRAVGRSAPLTGEAACATPQRAAASFAARLGRGTLRGAVVALTALGLAAGYYGLSLSSFGQSASATEERRPPPSNELPESHVRPGPAHGSRGDHGSHGRESGAEALLHGLAKPVLATAVALLIVAGGGRLRSAVRGRRDGGAATRAAS